MSARINELISRYLDDSLSDGERKELQVWIELNPANADRFVEELLFDNRIEAEILAAQFIESEATSTERATPNRNAIAWVGPALAVAACLLIGAFIGLWALSKDGPPIAEGDNPNASGIEFVSVTQTLETEWENNSNLEVGDRLAAGTIHIRSGFVSLAFDDGVEVTLQGPARYELLGPGKTRLDEGLLTAAVPSGAEGFTVDTPNVEVVDLGTSFGVDVRKDGFSNVSVFEGEVEVSVSEEARRRRLREGESVRIGTDRQIEVVEFDPQRFAKLWPVSSGIRGSSEAFRFVPPWPRRIRFVESDTDIFVAEEGFAIRLPTELAVNISKPGAYSNENELTPSALPAGRRVRSYILHFSPVINAGPRRAERVTGTITFDRPVIGLIVLHDELVASSRRFTQRSRGESNIRRQLELTGDNNGDRIQLSDDRKTITLDLVSPGRTSDLVRVIVEGRRRFGPAQGRSFD